MSDGRRTAALAPFRIRSYRFQWTSDLATSWAFEMESIILGWYILTETGSVLLLTVYASLQYLGTLFAPMFGMLGDLMGTGPAGGLLGRLPGVKQAKQLAAVRRLARDPEAMQALMGGGGMPGMGMPGMPALPGGAGMPDLAGLMAGAGAGSAPRRASAKDKKRQAQAKAARKKNRRK